MLSLRILRSHILTILTLINLSLLSFYFLYPRWSRDENDFLSPATPELTHYWKDKDQGLILQDLGPPVTITITEVKTALQTEIVSISVTKTVEVATPSPSPVPLKTPGPPFCDACGPEDSLCRLYGEHNLARSRVYEGSNARFRRVIRSAIEGKPTKIGIIGGSVSVGHGLSRIGDKWLERYLKAWKELFPKSETTLVNGAVPATGTDYMSMCFGQHIDENVDLVIIELSINDQRIEENAVAYEWLIRGLLALPNSPAVINIHTIGLSFEYVTTGGDLHTPISEYYDAPVISLRNMLATHIYNHSELDEYYFGRMPDPKTPDWRHINNHGHELMNDILVAYTQRQICAVEKDKAEPHRRWVDTTGGKLLAPEGLEGVPRIRFFQKYDRTSVTDPVTPYCRSVQTEKYPLDPIESKGWDEWYPPQTPDKHYLRATEVGAWIKMEVIVGVMHRVRITYLRSKTFGLGDVWCWLDEDRKMGKRVRSWWKLDNINIAFVEVITTEATLGRHILTCEVMEETSDPEGGHEFRLISVDAS